MNYCRWLDCTTLIFPIFCGLIGSWCEWKAAQNKSVSERTTLTRKGEKVPQPTSEYYICGSMSPDDCSWVQLKTIAVFLVDTHSDLRIHYLKWRSNFGTNNNLMSFRFRFCFPWVLAECLAHGRLVGHVEWTNEWMTKFSGNMPR